MPNFILGIDLDNTLINYNQLFYNLAVESELIDLNTPANKTAVRNRVRKLYTDAEWQKLQWYAYGSYLHKASLFPFVRDALKWLTESNIKLYIISHKTEYADIDKEKTVSLRESALNFLEEQGIFSFIPSENVIFCNSMTEKCAAIARVNCTDFIDDLPEFLGHDAFPNSVHKIMFCPQGIEFPNVHNCSILRSFNALSLFFTPQKEKTRIHGGRNSRVWHWQSPIGAVAIKDICCVADDPRQRDAAEWRAWCFLEEYGLNKQPTALMRDVRYEQIISTWINGAAIKTIENNDIEQLSDFFKELYELREFAQVLPPAADACFNLRALDIHIQERIDRLLNAKREQRFELEYNKLSAFLKWELIPIYEESIKLSYKAYAENNILVDMALSSELCMPSPSDFGLHNALRTNAGLKFIDFEYFGKDDPVKLICDTILHPALPMTEAERQDFFNMVCEKCQFIEIDKNFMVRFKSHFPLWKIKWACIILNEFLKSGQKRRIIANESEVISSEILQLQLQKAEQMLQKNMPCL